MLVARYDKTYQKNQTLKKHCENVAKMTGANLAPYGLESFGQILGWLHDLCKGTFTWQSAIEAEKERYLASGGKAQRRPLGVNHAPPAACLIYHLLEQKSEQGSSGMALQILCMTVYAHHGYLMDALTPNGDNKFGKDICERKIENADGVERFFDEVISVDDIYRIWEMAKNEIDQVLEKVVSACTYINKNASRTLNNARYFMLGMLTRLTYSALIDADRLDAANFEANVCTLKMDKESPDWGILLKQLETRIEKFDQETYIDRMRHIISLSCAKAAVREDALQKLHAPTGGGKTLAGLRWALLRSIHKKRRKIFYIVSYTTILDQVYGEYIGLFKENKNLDILLHHSNVIPDEEQETGRGSNFDEKEERQLLLAERWDSDIILTTQVQFFNALFLGTGKAARRMRALHNAVIIFDEVQTIPVRLTHLFNMSIAWLTGVCHCDVLLSTATQPILSQLEYPMPEAKNIFDDPDDLFRRMKRVVIHDERHRGPMSAGDIAEFVYDKQRKYTSVLVVLNTRTAARKVYDALKSMEISEVPLYLLSNNMCVAHRNAVIDDLKDLDGKPSICISTQLIECGVDLSFGCAVRSLAGADNIWQTAGRCNRHGKVEGETRPVYIIQCSEENLRQLKDIELAQRACINTLHYHNEADDLQLPGTMNEYYEYYYQRQSDYLSFNIPPNGGDIRQATTIVDMLSVNKVATDIYVENHFKKPSLFLSQAFNTAGKKFAVIDSPTICLLVPYGRGAKIIEELSGEPTLEREKKLLKEAQLYTINVFRYHLDQIGASAFWMLDCGVTVLNPEWYDVVKRGLLMEPEYQIDKHIVT